MILNAGVNDKPRGNDDRKPDQEAGQVAPLDHGLVLQSGREALAHDRVFGIDYVRLSHRCSLAPLTIVRKDAGA
jgi:hypothetical protein